MTRASTPGSLSTVTTMVWDSMCVSFWIMFIPTSPWLNHHFAFFGNLGLFFGIRKDHLVMRRAGRDHGIAILVRVDADIEEHRPVHREHLLDLAVELVRLLGAYSHRAIGFRELDEIGQGL